MDSNKSPLPTPPTTSVTPPVTAVAVATADPVSIPPVTAVAVDTADPASTHPKFEQWKQTKLLEAQTYLKNAWGMEVAIDKLVLHPDNAGFPDPVRWAGAHKQILANMKFKDENDEVLNSYNIWRSLD
jgi:hypothetical protein